MGLLDSLMDSENKNTIIGTVLAPGVGTLFGMNMDYTRRAAKEAQDAREKASATQQAAINDAIAQIDKNWKLPVLDRTPLTPEQITLLQRYVPTVAQYTKEQMPELMSGKGAQEAISMQRQVAQQLQEQAATGETSSEKAARDLGQFQAEQAGRGQRANILRDMANRGLSGSGASLSAQIQSAGQQEEMARQAALQAAIAGGQRKQQALASLQGLAGNMRSSAENQERTNMDAINAFNQRSSMTKNQYDQYVAGLQNQAQALNISEAQRIAEQNAANRQRIAQYNQALANQTATQTAGDENERLRAILGLKTGLAGNIAANQIASGQAAAGQNQAIANTAGGVLTALPGLAATVAGGPGAGAATKAATPNIAAPAPALTGTQSTAGDTDPYGVLSYDKEKMR